MVTAAPSSFVVHVLFIDLVRLSMRPNPEQANAVSKLTAAIRGSNEVERALTLDHLLIVPTGDGAALVFDHDPESPARCALELAPIIPASCGVPFRMGIHSGPVMFVVDPSNSGNVAGSGINYAERIMRCAEENQITVSGTSTDLLIQSGYWDDRLYYLGPRRVKHGKQLDVYLLLPDRESGTDPRSQWLRRKRRMAETLRAIRPRAFVLMVLAYAAYMTVVAASSRFGHSTNNNLATINEIPKLETRRTLW